MVALTSVKLPNFLTLSDPLTIYYYVFIIISFCMYLYVKHMHHMLI